MKRRSILKAALAAPLTLLTRYAFGSSQRPSPAPKLESLTDLCSTVSPKTSGSIPLPMHAKKIPELLGGIAENIVSVNPFFQVLPFDPIHGNALAYERERADDGSLFQSTAILTKIIGDAEVHMDFSHRKDIQIAHKAKHIGRVYNHMLVNGATGFCGLPQLCAKSQRVRTAKNGSALSFKILDRLLALTPGTDFFMMPLRTIRSYKWLVRETGVEGEYPSVMVGGEKVISYKGVPIFRNDYLPEDQKHGTCGHATTIYAGTFDDGSRTKGLSGLCYKDHAGLSVVEIGETEDGTKSLTRVKWYAGLALFSEKCLACAPGITH